MVHKHIELPYCTEDDISFLIGVSAQISCRCLQAGVRKSGISGAQKKKKKKRKKKKKKKKKKRDIKQNGWSSVWSVPLNRGQARDFALRPHLTIFASGGKGSIRVPNRC